MANELLFAFPQRHLSDGCESAALALKMSFGRNEVTRVIAFDQAADVGDRPFDRVMPVTGGHLVKHDLAIFQGNAGEMLRDGLLFSGMHATGPYQIRRLERDNRAINFGAVVRLSRALPLRIRPYILSHHHSGSRFIDDADVEWWRSGSRLIGSACSRRCIRTCSRIRARVGMYVSRRLPCTKPANCNVRFSPSNFAGWEKLVRDFRTSIRFGTGIVLARSDRMRSRIQGVAGWPTPT
ncbi:hypothetical protein AWB68_07630 [Caballeronia choica]|uniref:Uncharacterized protein n=1 Tax=Caballeronia choica TaxID=326476 RepID=A0A158KY07_9BURK|nr:hypothetical protein AWB68_07630 [Caballeronia choica]